MITDPIGDFLTRLRNSSLNQKGEVVVPYSKIKAAIAQVLKKEGYVSQVQKEGNSLQVSLAFRKRQPIITGIKNISKPGLRIYKKRNKLPYTLKGAGIAIISTSEGIMSDKEARKKKLGGEVIGQVW